MAVTDYADGGFAASGEDAQRIFAQFKKVNGLNGSSDEDKEDDQEDPPKKNKKGYWGAFSESSIATDPFYQVGQRWTRWVGEGSGVLFEDVGNTFCGFAYNLGSLFFAETWVDMYNSGKLALLTDSCTENSLSILRFFCGKYNLYLPHIIIS
ncbi:hypothetical protein [Sphingobacterium sp. LRF_L2]|uniref:hypothetical protein n=1 Tax=Sphingobacterium sp. LRF_L2 TaxID=3369421 RepID=UPI003F5DED57